MKSRKSAGKKGVSSGYTIIEVLIVLAVSMALFIVVAATFSGREGRAELSQSVREFESQIQNVANDVANGFYPNGFTCNVPAAGAVDPLPGVKNPGENTGCIFLGKVMAFNAQDNGAVLTIVGRQFQGDVTTPATTSLLDALPVAVAKAVPPGPDVTKTFSYKNRLKVLGVTRIGTNTPVGALAFMSQLGGGVGASNPLTGSRSTLLYYVNNTVSPNTLTNVQIANLIRLNGFTALPGGATICLEAGGGQRAEIKVGDGNNQTSTFVTLDTGANTSACPYP